MSENKIKHLEFIQEIVSRNNSNSFTIKGWSTTIVAAIFALAAKDSDARMLYAAYVPAVMFWILDGFFLSYERRYRELYDAISRKSENQIDFSLKMPKRTIRSSWFSCTFFSINTIFHGILVVLILFLMYIFKSTS